MAAVLTERLLNLPLAVADWYARPGTYRHGEVLSDAYLALWRGAAKYDPSRGASAETFLYRYVHARVREWQFSAKMPAAQWRWRRLKPLSLDAPLGGAGAGGGGGSMYDLEADRRRPASRPWLAVEQADAVADLLRHLSGRFREAVELCVLGGWTQEEVAEEWGVSKQRVHQVLDKALDRLRQVLTRNDAG